MNKVVHLSDYKGKVIVLDFGFTGCFGCTKVKPILNDIEKFYMGTKEIVFLSVCVDSKQDSFVKSVRGLKYTTEHSINLHTVLSALNHPIIKDFKIASFPTILLIGKGGKIFDNPTNPLVDNGVSLKKVSGKQYLNERALQLIIIPEEIL